MNWEENLNPHALSQISSCLAGTGNASPCAALTAVQGLSSPGMSDQKDLLCSDPLHSGVFIVLSCLFGSQEDHSGFHCAVHPQSP